MAYISLLLALASLVLFVHADGLDFRNSLYIIHQAETPLPPVNATSLGPTGPGLTLIGLRRAEQCLPNLFKDMDIGLIVSCTPDLDTGACFAALETVTPLAKSLGLQVNTSCDAFDNSDDNCAMDLLKDFAKTSQKSILAVWDIGDEGNFIEKLGLDFPDDIDDGVSHYDVITTMRDRLFIGRTSQNCAGIDGRAAGCCL